MKHHGGARGKVRVRVHEEGQYNVFTVEDDGAGLPAGAEDMIFNRLSVPAQEMPAMAWGSP